MNDRIRNEPASTTAKSPFIWSQKIKWLNEKTNPRKYLSAEYFRSQRPSRGDSDANSRSGEPAEPDPWSEISRHDLFSHLIDLNESPTQIQRDIQRWQRLVITTDAGIGKSVNLQWLCKEINRTRKHHNQTALLMRLGDFESSTQIHASAGQPVLEYLVHKFSTISGIDQDKVRRALQRSISRGRLILLIDELDHVSSESLAITRIKDILYENEFWKGTQFVIGGRPNAVTGVWDEFFAKSQWQFVQVMEFEQTQQTTYLGEKVFKKIPNDSHEILQIPRVISYVRELSLIAPEELDTLKTPSDVYYKSMLHLIDQGIDKSKKAQDLGKRDGRFPERNDQIQLAMKFLGAIAYRQISTPPPRKDWKKGTKGLPNFNRVSGKVELEKFLDKTFDMVRHRLYAEHELLVFKSDVDSLRAMNEALSEGIVDSKSMKEILWRNRSLQEFFAGYWLANHYDGSDEDQLYKWLYIPHLPESEDYYWVWRYAVEMPFADPDAWTLAIKPIFRPGDGTAKNTKRSCEMMYRSWFTLQQLADIESHETAIEIRTNFLAEFQQIRSGSNHQRKESAEDFVRLFKDVQAGTFQMGSAPDDTDRYDDETPEPGHEMQSVAAFQMNRFPTLNCWYRLFDPAHGTQHRTYYERYSKSPSDEHPVIHVSWFDSWAFCLWAHWDDASCRLPREFEWEFVCKAGTNTRYWWSNDFDSEHCTADFRKNKSTTPPRKFDSETQHRNPWGFTDMSGNVLEWTDDVWRNNYARIDACPVPDYSSRVLRGGSWNDNPWGARSAFRDLSRPSFSDGVVGFRVVRARKPNP